MVWLISVKCTYITLHSTYWLWLMCCCQLVDKYISLHPLRSLRVMRQLPLQVLANTFQQYFLTRNVNFWSLELAQSTKHFTCTKTQFLDLCTNVFCLWTEVPFNYQLLCFQFQLCLTLICHSGWQAHIRVTSSGLLVYYLGAEPVI